MDNNLLITSEDMRAYVRLPESLNPDEIDPHIRNAQEEEIAELLGAEMYYLVLENTSDQIYQDLINGKVYRDSNGNNINFPGMKVVLIYYAYARYIGERNVHDTETGLVSKKNEYSQPVDSKEISRLINNARASAAAYQRKTIRFIIDHGADYPLWYGQHRETSGSGVTIRAAGKKKNFGNGNYPPYKTKNRCDGTDYGI